MPANLRESVVDALTYAAIDKSLTDIIEAKIVECAAGKRPAEYFYLTEMVNPMEAYWHRVSPLPQPVDILKKLKYGSKMHYASRFWFRNLPGYGLAEATLNGFYVGILGVVGRVDYTVGESIWEFKTKEKETISLDDVLDSYPHDLEQLLFYATLAPRHPATNYLVYMTRAKDGSARFFAFRADIKDFRPLERELKRRIAALTTALSDRDPSGLPRCRYFAPGCRFGGPAVCNCASSNALSARGFLSALTVQADPALSRKVTELYEANRHLGDGYGVWDLILPRKWYHEYFDYSVDEELAAYSGLDPDKLSLVALLDSAVGSSSLGVGPQERKTARAIDNLKLSGGRRFMKVHIPARSPLTMTVPYTVHKHAGSRIPAERDLPDIYYSEVALQCARSGVSTGIVVVHFPKLSGRTVCYAMGFDMERVTHAANSAKEALREARQNGSPTNLDHCPEYMAANCSFSACSCRSTPRSGV